MKREYPLFCVGRLIQGKQVLCGYTNDLAAAFKLAANRGQAVWIEQLGEPATMNVSSRKDENIGAARIERLM